MEPPPQRKWGTPPCLQMFWWLPLLALSSGRDSIEFLIHRLRQWSVILA